MKSQLYTLLKREFKSYFQNPIGAIYISLYVFFSVLIAIQIGQLIEFNEASLYSFFEFQPYILLLFVPALGMRIWSEDNKSGTIDVLLSLPIKDYQLILGKYFASLLICLIALIACIPLWISINFLGKADNFIALGGFISCLMIASIYLVISMAISMVTKNQIIAYLISLLFGFLFLASGMPIVINMLDGIGFNLGNLFAQISLLDDFENMIIGQFSYSAIIKFILIIGFGLYINFEFLKLKRWGHI
ncbi:MAG: ABC transporter permease subunit [Caulobacterales bacterium]|nr:ABC transporter permease subunit [Caulobacterales bacterium]MCA0372026.1 ABC transporter permease [Pseudomonadota bacterium]